MTIEQTRAKITSSVWKAIAQSDVDLSVITSENQEKMVNKITETVMITMNELFDEVPQTLPIDEPDEFNEKIIWQGRPFLSLVEAYTLTSERIKVKRGLLSRDLENFELIRVQDIDVKQNLSERAFGIGDIKIRGQDPSNPSLVLRNVPEPEKVYEVMRRTWLEARKRHGLTFHEYM